MSYAQVVSNAIVPGTEQGGLPASARRLDNQQWVMGLATATVALQQATGWYQVDASAVRPADTPTHTTDRTLTLVGQTPTVTWVSRPKTQAELDATTQGDNKTTLRTRLNAARTANNNWLAIVSPTNAQAIAYLDTVAKEFNGLIVLIEDQWFGNSAALNDIADSS